MAFPFLGGFLCLGYPNVGGNLFFIAAWLSSSYPLGLTLLEPWPVATWLSDRAEALR